jgi:hypothetical protein
MLSSTIIGTVGATLVLIAFISNQSHHWTEKSCLYNALNFLGSLLLVIAGMMINFWPSVILNSIWSAVSLRSLMNWNKTKNIQKKFL